jgi:uncharacterized protein
MARRGVHLYAAECQDVVLGACCTVNPADTGTAVTEAERCLRALGALGLSFHHRFLGLNIDDARMKPLLELAGSYDRPVFVHIIAESTLEAPWRLFVLARMFPEVRFVALDGFSSPNQSAYLRSAAAYHPNVWFDTAVASSVAHGFRESRWRASVSRRMISS